MLDDLFRNLVLQRLGADKCQLRWSSLFQSHDRTAETRLIFTVLTSPICVTSLLPISAASLGECQDELQFPKQTPCNSLQSLFRLHFRLRDVLICGYQAQDRSLCLQLTTLLWQGPKATLPLRLSLAVSQLCLAWVLLRSTDPIQPT